MSTLEAAETPLARARPVAGTCGVAVTFGFALAGVPAVRTALLALWPRVVRPRFFVPLRAPRALELRLTLRERAGRELAFTSRLVRLLGPDDAKVDALPDIGTPATAVIETRFLVPAFVVVVLGLDDATGAEAADGTALLALLPLDCRSVFLAELAACLLAGTF